MFILEILVTIFAIFAISRSYLKLKNGNGSIFEFLIWVFVWSLILLITYFPSITSYPAKLLGIGRGIDVFIYFAIIVLIYSTYRIYSKIEKIEQEITTLTREIAIKEANDKNSKKTIANSSIKRKNPLKKR